MDKTRLICIVGPTGAGKTAASLHLAARFGGAVVNCDSRQVYAGLGVTTAQPSAQERAQCPHLLYGFLEPDRELSAGAYAEHAANALDSLKEKGLTPLLVGGTGLYLKALLEGLDEIPAVPAEVRERVRDAYAAHGPEAMHARLAAVDPEYAAKIHPNDRQRVTRALEVHAATGRAFSSWHGRRRAPSPYAAVKLGIALPADASSDRLARRIDLMLEAGAVEEVRRVLEGYPPEARALTGIGCAELAAHLRGELTLDEAKALWLKNTRAYAKRQMTWFRKDKEIAWFAPDQAKEAAVLVEERFSGE